MHINATTYQSHGYADASCDNTLWSLSPLCHLPAEGYVDLLSDYLLGLSPGLPASQADLLTLTLGPP